MSYSQRSFLHIKGPVQNRSFYMFKFFGLGLEPTVRVQCERAEAGAFLRLCWKHKSKMRNAVKCERARQPGEFFIGKIKEGLVPVFVFPIVSIVG